MSSGDYEARGREKPCRTCFDPRTWFKSTQGQTSSGSGDVPMPNVNRKAAELNQEPTLDRRSDCPVFVDELGRSSWTLLHTMAAKFPDNPTDQQKKEMTELLRLLAVYYPCEFCASDFRRDLREMPPDLSSQKDFARWMCRMHNLVNKKLGKAQFDCDLVQQRWRDGWADGSCD